LYVAGHSVHWIQAKRSGGEHHRWGQLVGVEENRISIDFGSEIKQYRNCDPDRLLEIVGLASRVRVCERFVILRALNGYCFSIANADEPWVPCDHSPLTSASPEALQARLQTHGGFSVSGAEVLKHLGDGS
jgi:hypothetical protein